MVGEYDCSCDPCLENVSKVSKLRYNLFDASIIQRCWGLVFFQFEVRKVLQLLEFYSTT